MQNHRDEVGNGDGEQPRQERLARPERCEVHAENEGADKTKFDGLAGHTPNSESLRRLNRCLIALIIAVTLSVFSVVRQADFVHWDDGVNIYNNPHIHGLNSASLRWMFTDASYIPRYMPLGWMSLAVDYQLTGGFNPTTYHLGNLLLHCANAVLVFLLLKRLITLSAKNRGRQLDGRALAIAAAVGALFWAVHPLRAEPVAWASARIYCTASFLAFLSALLYLRYVAGESRRRSYWLAVILFLASLLTYPIALGFIPVLLVMEFYPLRRVEFSKSGLTNPAARRALLEKVPFIIVGVLVLVVTAWARIHAQMWVPPVSLEDFGVFSRVMQAFYVWATYLWKTCAPINLAPMYSTLVSFDPLQWPFLLSAFVIIGVSVALLRNRRRWPAATTIWISYLILLVPMLGLSEHPHHANDRYSYIPALLASLVVAALLLRVQRIQIRNVALVGSSIILITCGFLSFRQAAHWKNRETLLSYLTSTIGEHPLRSSQDLQLGFVFRGRGEDDKAAASFENALRADPNSFEAHRALADVLSEHRHFDNAIAHYRDALRLNPAGPKARQNFAITLASIGRLNEAAEQFQELIRLNPTDADANHNLAITLGKLGRSDEAKAAFAQAQRLREPHP